MQSKLILASLLSVAMSGTALSADLLNGQAEAPSEAQETYPNLSGTLDLELADDYVFSSDDPLEEINDLNATAELAARLALTRWVAINGGATLETVLDGLPGEDRTFDDMGLYIDTLNAEFNYSRFTITLGKYSPTFGTAWDITPGVYGTEFAEDYELSELIGGSVAVDLGNTAFGNVVATANVFFVDTTFFSESVFTNRGRVRLGDGGIGKTEQFNNFSFTLDGSDIASVDGLSWHLGYRHLSAGVGDVSDENGFVAGLAREFSTGDYEWAANAEIAYFDGAGGTGDDALYLTGGVAVGYNQWHGELAGNIRNIDFAAGGSDNDFLIQASAGYEFANGIDLSAGLAHIRQAGISSNVVGMRLTKGFEF